MVITSFSDWKIRTKIVVCFSVAALMALAAGLTGIVNLNRVDDADTRMYEYMTVPTGDLAQMAKSVQRVRVNMRDVVFGPAARRQAYADTIEVLLAGLDETSVKFAEKISSDEVQAQYSTFVTSRKAFRPYLDRVVSLALAGDTVGARAVLYSPEAYRSARAVEQAIDNLVATKVRHAKETSDANTALAQSAVLYMVLAVLVAVFSAIGLGLFLARRISRPVGLLEEAAARVTEGDHSVAVDVVAQDEIGHLARSFNAMVATIRQGVEALKAEKASIQQQVDDAVRDSETQRAYLTRKVDEILAEMDRFADGDLTVNLDVESQDEIGRLFEGFNRAVKNMSDMLQRVGLSVEATASASAEISASTEQLASASQEQSAQANEVAAAVEQMVRTIVENSRNTTHTAELAGQNGTLARESGDVVLQTVGKMREIAEVVHASAETVERLGTSSNQIGEIVQVIGEIADQTNLLALNAAIEAARAGDQGRGFAVVADEVRKLAERTMNATKEIGGMIRSIQHETAAAVAAIQKGNAEVSEGIQLADHAGNALEKVVAGSLSMVDLMTQVAAATEEQSSTSEQISRSVEAIAHVSEESATGIGQIARSTDDLSRLTDELRLLVSRFKTHGSPAPSFSGDGHRALPVLS